MPSNTGAGMPRSVKIVALGVLAAAGLGWAGWRAYGAFFRDEKPRSRMITDIGGGGQAPAREGVRRRVEQGGEGPVLPTPYGYAFEAVGSDEELAAQMTAATERIAAAAGEAQAVRDVGANAAAELAASTVAVFEPLLQGDVESYFAAVEGLGGARPAEGNDGPRRMFEGFAKTLDFASIDTSKITIHPVKTGKDADPYEMGGPGNVMMMNNRSVDDKGNETTTTTIKAWPEGLFEGLAGFVEKGMRAVEVRAPVRTKGNEGEAADMHLGVIMVWQPSTRQWQPTVWNLYVFNQELLPGLMPRRGGG